MKPIELVSDVRVLEPRAFAIKFVHKEKSLQWIFIKAAYTKEEAVEKVIQEMRENTEDGSSSFSGHDMSDLIITNESLTELIEPFIKK